MKKEWRFHNCVKFIIIFFFFFSCEKKKDYKIEGKWIFVKEYNMPYFDKNGDELPPLPPRQNLGFNFYSIDSCEANEEFYEPKSFDVDYFSVKLGRKTLYEIENDSLLIFNKTLQKWEVYKILNVDENNLTLLYRDNLIKSFARKVKK